jgi:hypothetical protein
MNDKGTHRQVMEPSSLNLASISLRKISPKTHSGGLALVSVKISNER